MTGFKPCPICGRALTEKNIEFYDDDSYIGDMEMIHDFGNIMNPSNSVYEDDWKKLDEFDRKQVGNNYVEAAEAVEDFMVACPCGFRFVVDRWSTRYPENGWLDEVKDEVNSRSLLAMLQSLDLIVEEHTGCDRDAARIARSAVELMRHQLFNTSPIGEMCKELEQVRAEIDEVLEAWSR